MGAPLVLLFFGKELQMERVLMEKWKEKNVTYPLQKLINQCSSEGGGVVKIPSGQYTIDSIELKDYVTLYLERGARLIGSGDEQKYWHRPGPFELKQNMTPLSSLIHAERAKHIAIKGYGTIDGNYQRFILPNQDDEPHLKFYKYPRPMMIYFQECQDVSLKEITLQNSPFWTVHLVGNDGVYIDGLTIKNEVRMPNTDGFDIDRSKNVIIQNCFIQTGDDAFCPKCTEETSEYGDVENLIVRNCRVITQSSAVKFGSSSFGNFRNCYFSKLIIRDTNRGLAFQLRDSGNAENIIFEDIDIQTKHYSQEWWGSGEPIYITLLPRTQTTDLTKCQISNVIFRRINAVAENGVLMISQLPGQIKGIRFEDVFLKLKKSLNTRVEYDLRPVDQKGKIQALLKGITDFSESKFEIKGGNLINPVVDLSQAGEAN